jgi:cytochrome b subunit of formate dehydrogenase
VYKRFSLVQRIEHVLMLLSFTTLAVTGLPQKFADNGFSLFLIRLAGGIEGLRAVHHVAATILMLGAVYHLLSMGYTLFVLRRSMTMLPTLKDIRDAWQAFAYNLGLGKSRPQMGRYTFEEKAEYWALIWGTVIMGLTGYLMWNPVTAARLFPGEFIPAAKAAHGAEAVLAVLAIIVWHMYGVHIKRFNKAMWTGNLTEEEMLHEHPLELADMKAGLADRPVPPDVLRKRRAIYFPIAAVLAIAMLAGVYGFVNGEETAFSTVARPELTPSPVYDPQTPTPIPSPLPTATPPPTTTPLPEGSSAGATGWETVAPLLQQQCGICHGSSATAGLAILTYADLMAGSANGPVVKPGDAASSPLVTRVQDGSHPGKFTAEQLQIIIDWINAGAPE